MPPETPPNRKAAHLADPLALMQIKSLALRARVVVDGLVSGLHRSPTTGFSSEFNEYRQYSPGDDLRYFDWKVFAKCDRSYIKKFEDETNLRCLLVTDYSHSMQFSSGSISKLEYASTLAATLAWFINWQRDAVGLAVFNERLVDFLPPKCRKEHLERLIRALESPVGGRETHLSRALEDIGLLMKKRGMVILISDFLSPLDRLMKGLREVASAGHDVRVFRVLDPEELQFSFSQTAVFRDMESAREIFLDPVTARDEYVEKFQHHTDELEHELNGLGVINHTVTTDQPYGLVLGRFLRDRPQTSRVTRSARQGRYR